MIFLMVTIKSSVGDTSVMEIALHYCLLFILLLLEILEDCIVFLNERIYISALYRRHKCAVQIKCSTSISVHTSKESSWA